MHSERGECEMSNIYLVDIREKVPREVLETFECMLSERTKEKIKKFKFQEDYYRSLYGEILVRKIVSQQVGIRPEKINIDRNSFGKPYVKNLENIYFNISHAGDWVACVVSGSECGIDIERVGKVNLRIAERFFHKKEYAALINKTHENRIDYFFELWTLKESYIKYKGKGLYIPLNSFCITEKRGNYKAESETEEVVFTQYNWDSCYKIAACTKDQVQNIIKLGINELL